MEFSGQSALITGSAKRTGRDIALELAKKDIEAIIHYRSSENEAEQTVEEIISFGGKAYCLQADLSDFSQASKLVREIQKRSKKLDILINNVGNYLVKPILDTTSEEWEYLIQSTATVTFNTCKAAIELMTNQKYGRIVNIGDAGADYIKDWPDTTPYMIGKTGVLILTKSLSKVCAKNGITVNMVSPGMLENTTFRPEEGETLIPNGKYGTSKDVTNAIMFLLKKESNHITGSNIKISGGWNI